MSIPESVSSNLEIEFFQMSDPGLVRDHNEDAIGYSLPDNEEQARERGWLFVLADGVGGHDRGEVASAMTVSGLVEGFRKTALGEPLSGTLPRLIQSANLAVYEAAQAGGGGKSMATTVVACLLRYDRAVVAHVGDSRCYLIRQGRAAPLTRDHTFSQEQLRMGLLTVREAAAAQTSNILSRSVGSDMIVNVDVQEHWVVPGDLLLLCSDGLHNSVLEKDMAEAVQEQSDLQGIATKLIDAAKQRDGRDNISIQLIRIKGVERVGLYRGRHYKVR